MISALLVNESNDSHLELTNAPFVILVKLNEPCYMSILPKKLFNIKYRRCLPKYRAKPIRIIIEPEYRKRYHS